MVKRTAVVLALAAILSAVPAAAASSPEGLPLTAAAHRRDLAVVVRVIGRLEAQRSTVVSSSVRGDRGKIVSIVEDGARVRQGDLLIRLDPTPFEEEVARLAAKEQEQQANVDANEQILEWEKVQADRDVEKAAFDQKVAALDLERLQKGDGPFELARLEGAARKARKAREQNEGYLLDLEALEKKGYANATEIAAAGRAAEELRRESEQAQRLYENYREYTLPALIGKEEARVAQAAIDAEQMKKAVGFKVGKAMAAARQARQELDGTRAALKAARDELARAEIRAPIPGMVVLREEYNSGQKARPRVGDQVWQGQPLIYLPDLSRMAVRALVREIDLHRVVAGSAAAVSVDAYPDLRLPGRVESIGVMAETRGEAGGAEKYFQVLIALEGEEPRLRPGMTARAEIRFAEAKGALAIPLQAVFREEGQDVCYARRGAGFERRPVRLGLRSEEWAEVKAGLAPGEEVALTRPAGGLLRRATLP